MRIQRASPVQVATTPLPTQPMLDVVSEQIGWRPESCSQLHGRAVGSPHGMNALVGAIDLAFNQHRPLVLSPDMFWLTLLQGVGHHINQLDDPTAVGLPGGEKTTLQVRRDDFVLGSPENPWPEVFDDFSALLAEQLGDHHAALSAEFSTTGPVERAARDVALMAAMGVFFEYEFMTLCGIPEVRLEGHADDWRELAQRARALGPAFGCQPWIDKVTPRLDAIADNAAGADMPQLWRDLYREFDESGGPYITGWIVDFFPYLRCETIDDDDMSDPVYDAAGEVVEYTIRWIKDDEPDPPTRTVMRPNWFTGDEDGEVRSQHIPGGMASAPVRWTYLDQELDYRFEAGFTGITQGADLALRPLIGWAVGPAG